MHYEELWQTAEQFHQENSLTDSIDEILEELTLKIGLYKAINQRSEIPEEDKKEAKSRLLGEILLTFTNLSFKEDINVFKALHVALMQRSAEYNYKLTEG